MLQTVTCPHCQRKLAVEIQHVGAEVVCPMCKKSFVPPGELDALPVAEPKEATFTGKPPLRPGRSPRRSTGSAGRDFADSAGIDLDEEHEVEVTTSTVAERRLAEWKEEMPEVQSAYQPSGKMPAGAVATMGIGAMVGGAGGALAFLVGGGVAALLTWGLHLFVEWMGNTCGRVLCIVVILEYAVGLLGAALAYVVCGWASATITTRAGMMGKNRNSLAAALFSIASVLLALVLGHVIADYAEKQFFPDVFSSGWLMWLKYIVEGVGSLLAILCAGGFSSQMIKDNKFCEECESYMEEEPRRGLKLGATRAIVLALKEQQCQAAAALLDCAEGPSGLPALYFCAACGKGYVEVKTSFKCTWVKGDDTESKEESWLAASVALEPDEVDLFRQENRKGRRSDT